MNAHVHTQLASLAVADRLRAAERARVARDARGTAVARHRHHRPGTGAIVVRRLRMPAWLRTA